MLAVTDLTLALSLTLLAVTLIVLLPGERLAQNRSGRISFNGMESLDVTGGARMAIVKATLTTSSTFWASQLPEGHLRRVSLEKTGTRCLPLIAVTSKEPTRG